MRQRIEQVFNFSQSLLDVIQQKRISFIAASLAYYALISIIPLLLLLLVLASLIGDETVIMQVVETVTAAFGPQAGSLVEEALISAAGRSGATLVGIGALLWSALKIFRGLDIAFAEVYGESGPDSLLDQLQNAIIAIGGVLVGVIATVVIGLLISLIGLFQLRVLAQLIGILGGIVSILMLTIAFFPIYYLLPGHTVTIKEVIPGTIFAAIGWTLLQTGFRWYASVAGAYEAYGVLGGVLLLVTWFYFGGFILLLGAVLNAVLANRTDPAITPE